MPFYRSIGKGWGGVESGVKFFLSILKGANQRDSSWLTTTHESMLIAVRTRSTPLAAMQRVLLI